MIIKFCSPKTLNAIDKVLKTNLTSALSDLSIGKMHVTDAHDLFAAFNINPVIAGVDVPIIIYPSEVPSNKTVVLIGQDPLRNPNDTVLKNPDYINNTNFSPSDVIVGTPFAMHFGLNSNGFPSTYTFVPMYCQIIDGYLDKGYNVYLTDISKLYIKDSSSKGNNSFIKLMSDKQYLQDSVRLLYEEVKILGNVAACIFLGKTAHKRIRKELANYPSLSQLSIVINHPSDTRMGKGHWDKDQGIDPHDSSAKARKIIGLVP